MSENVIKIDADGNCLFKAISFCVYNTQSKHLELRQRVVNHVSQNWDFHKDFIIGDTSCRLPMIYKQYYTDLISREFEYRSTLDLVMRFYITSHPRISGVTMTLLPVRLLLCFKQLMEPHLLVDILQFMRK